MGSYCGINSKQNVIEYKKTSIHNFKECEEKNFNTKKRELSSNKKIT